MGDAVRTLLVDIGGTLIVRSSPGPFQRVVRVLADAGVDVADPRRRTALARALLTGADRRTAADRAAHSLALPQSSALAVAQALVGPEGQATVLPGAVDLLSSAATAGWRVVAVSNAAAWSEELPASLSRHLDTTVTSAVVGRLKQEPEFWAGLQAEQGVTPSCCLVVGDSPEADGEAPASAGFCSVVVGHGKPSVTEVTRWLEAAAPPPDEPLGLVAGKPSRWAGQPILAAPHLATLVVAVTRLRVRASLSGRTVGTILVRRRDLPPALLLPADAGPGLAWLAVAVDRRNMIIPGELAEALTAAGLSMDHLPERDRRHVVSMVREARDPAVRQARIDDVMNLLRSTAGPCGPVGGA